MAYLKAGSETDDETTAQHGPSTRSGSLDDTTGNDQQSTDHDGGTTAKQVGDVGSGKDADETTQGVGGADQPLRVSLDSPMCKHSIYGNSPSLPSSGLSIDSTKAGLASKPLIREPS